MVSMDRCWGGVNYINLFLLGGAGLMIYVITPVGGGKIYIIFVNDPV